MRASQWGLGRKQWPLVCIVENVIECVKMWRNLNPATLVNTLGIWVSQGAGPKLTIPAWKNPQNRINFSFKSLCPFYLIWPPGTIFHPLLDKPEVPHCHHCRRSCPYRLNHCCVIIFFENQWICSIFLGFLTCTLHGWLDSKASSLDFQNL